METRTTKMMKVGKVVGWSLLALLFLGFFGTAMTGVISLPDTPDAASYVLGFGSVALIMGLFGYMFYLEEYRGYDFRVASARQSSPQRQQSGMTWGQVARQNAVSTLGYYYSANPPSFAPPPAAPPSC